MLQVQTLKKVFQNLYAEPDLLIDPITLKIRV